MKLKKGISVYFWNKHREFVCTEFYWKSRHRAYQLRFKTKNLVYRVQKSVDDKKVSVSIVNNIALSGLSSLVWALILFFLLTTVDSVITKWLPQVHTLGTTATQYILTKFNSQVSLSRDSYSDFMGGLSSVAGVFLGLYFTVISVGIGPHVSNLSPNLRQLIVNEKTGSRYVDLLTIFTALTFLLWFNAGTFDNFSLLSIFFVLAYALFLICAFYPLGQKSFFLADPDALALPLFENLNSVLNKLKSTKSIYFDDSFQNHFQSQISYQVDSVEEVLDLALEKDAKGKEYVTNIIQNLFGQILYYLSFKQLIPKESYWFQRVVKHEDWLYQDDIKTNLLKALGSIPEPTTIPDLYWFEKKVNNLVLKALRHYKNLGDSESLVQILTSIRNTLVGPLAYGWNTDLAINVYQEVEQELKDFIFNQKIGFKKRLLVTEHLVAIRVDIIQQALQRVISDNFHERISELAISIGKGSSSINVQAWETPALKAASELLNSKIEFEIQVEGKRITPIWYIQQVLASESAKETGALLSSFGKLLTNFEKPNIKTSGFQDAAITALILQRQVETAMRLKTHVGYYNAYINKLKALEKISEVKIDGLLQTTTESLGKHLDEYYDQMSDIILILFQGTRNDDLPDFFGLLYTQLADKLFQLLEENNAEKFQSLFSKLLLASIFARQRLTTEYANSRDPVAHFKMSFDPIVDMMHLSGYAKLYSELFDRPSIFSHVIEGWQKTLPQLNIHAGAAQWLIQCFLVLKSDYRSTKGATRRFQWENEFGALLIEKGFIRHPFDYSAQNIPNSPYLKEICAGGSMIHHDMSEVFLTAFLLETKASEEVTSQLNSDFLRRIIKTTEKDSVR